VISPNQSKKTERSGSERRLNANKAIAKSSGETKKSLKSQKLLSAPPKSKFQPSSWQIFVRAPSLIQTIDSSSVPKLAQSGLESIFSARRCDTFPIDTRGAFLSLECVSVPEGSRFRRARDECIFFIYRPSLAHVSRVRVQETLYFSIWLAAALAFEYTKKSISAAQVVQPGLRLLRGLESFETGPTPLELAGLIYPTDNMQIWSGAPAFFALAHGCLQLIPPPSTHFNWPLCDN
jgi:hypothetical protein